jgi:predicted DNA-binding transcriptional regulator YafY
MATDVSPTARALLALEAIQNRPGITARGLGDRLGVTERAARRYVAILREADLPIESVSGPHGGYRVGRGLRLPPLMFTAAEAMGLVMAVLEGHRNAADPADLVGAALAKIVRVLPERVAGPARAFREVSASPLAHAAPASPELTTELIEACGAGRRLRLEYRLSRGRDTVMEVDPWAVVLRHSRWYLLAWSHSRQAQRVLRVDRIARAEAGPTRSRRRPTSMRCASWRSTSPRAGTTRWMSWSTPPPRRRRAGSAGAWPAWNRTGTAAPACALRPASRTGTPGS